MPGHHNYSVTVYDGALGPVYDHTAGKHYDRTSPEYGAAIDRLIHAPDVRARIVYNGWRLTADIGQPEHNGGHRADGPAVPVECAPASVGEPAVSLSRLRDAFIDALAIYASDWPEPCRSAASRLLDTRYPAAGDGLSD